MHILSIRVNIIRTIIIIVIIIIIKKIIIINNYSLSPNGLFYLAICGSVDANIRKRWTKVGNGLS